MHKSSLLLLGFSALATAQNVTEAPPPPQVLLTTTKSGVIPVLPTPFAGAETEQGAIVNQLPPPPGYTGLAGTAAIQSSQPAATYRAVMPPSMFNPLVGTTISGSLQAVGGPNGVTFTVNLTNLPDQAKYGPFPWHIHTLAVPSNGNCTATTGHLDPTNYGELYMCNPATPANCQVGDLAGKWGGKIMTNGTFTKTFTDPYLSVVPGTPGFFGGLAFVIHSGNTTRLTCANFQMVGGGNATSSATMSMSMSPSSTMGSMPSSFSAKADKAVVGMGALGVAVAAMFL